MRVLFLTPTKYSVGGFPVYYEQIVKALKKLGVNLYIENIRLSGKYLWDEVKSAKFFGSRLAEKYRGKVELVHASSIVYEAFAALEVAKILRIPSIASVHGPLIKFFKPTFKEFKSWLIHKYCTLLERKIINDIDYIIAFSRMERELLYRFYRRRHNIFVIPHGSDHTLEFECSERVGVSSSKPNYVKGGDIVLKIAERLPHIPFIMLGPKDGFVAKVSMTKNVRYLGTVDFELHCQEMGKTKLFILPSRYDSFPITVLEAMRLGVVPIISDRVGTKDIIREKSAGYVLPLDLDLWTEAINELYASDIPSLSKKAREVALEYTWEKSANEHLKAYEFAFRNSRTV
ncbi:MAG: glycosyltransferase family 4 protein [archaeon]|nr:glycosyltransferase family 4 protein [archaeon]MCP8314972.1 glycosyltransferase family 4 protein [archaeon]MCP8322145.1 glycosyltransferase family 4 protein [archaeon]